ncbi:MAG: aminoglycoside phosphotransferase, partial [Celeribacter marinus]
RMSLHFKKPHYVDLIPRVWAHLMSDLQHPDLAALRKVVCETLPVPTSENLQVLRDKCGTVPTM